MKFITLHLSQSRARIALRSSTFTKRALYRWRRRRLALRRVPTFTVSAVVAARSRSHPPLRGAVHRVVMRCICGRRGRRTKWRTKTERRAERKTLRERERRTGVETRASRQGGKGRDGDWERERSVEVTRLHASRTGPREREREQANERVRAARPA